MRKRGFVLVSAALMAMALGPPAAARYQSQGKVDITSLSADRGRVTGGDVLLAVDVPRKVSIDRLRLERNGRDVTAAFDPDPSRPRRLVGLVDGLSLGRNTIVAFEARRSEKHSKRLGELRLRNFPITGPVFSGPHQTPFICQTAETELGPPTDVDCSAATRTEFFYRSTDGSFRPLPDPASRPADLAQTTTRSGETVDYIVRVESGTINRAIYRWAVLAAGGEAGNGWNHRLVYDYGGGCGTGYHQGTLGQGVVLDNAVLSQGYAKASASLNTFQTACNEVLSAETTMMVKERIIESLRAVPAWMMGSGGSGGAIQQLSVAHNYPGLLDGIVPALTFQDAQLGEPVDCRLLNRYFNGPGAALTAAQRQAINGYRNIASCVAWDVAFADVIVADIGCDSAVPASLIYNAVTNPTGARCTLWDSNVNIWGRDPATGFARRTLDNVGVQYGLRALQEGAITADQFLDLNEKIGGYDNDGNPRPERAVADPAALAIAHRTGRINSGDGGLPKVPILDVRPYSDFPQIDIHTYVHSYIVRARLRQANGTAANQVMWRAAGGGVGPMTTAARELMADWLDALESDHSRRSLARKVIDAKPADAVDACWTAAGERIDDPAEINATGPCTQLYPPASTPRMRAGQPLSSLAIKCRLRPVDPGDYGALTTEQEARLHAVFPDGVCDYRRPGVGEQPLRGTWLSFETAHERP
jgi:Tannase-like family of unknown function (DUF6351)